jgi:hypothetical protein
MKEKRRKGGKEEKKLPHCQIKNYKDQTIYPWEISQNKSPTFFQWGCENNVNNKKQLIFGNPAVIALAYPMHSL